MPEATKTASSTKKRTAKKAVVKDPIPRYAIRSIKIDKNTTKRMAVIVDEATCEVCGYNVFIVNGHKLPFANLAEADEIQKQLVFTILKKHSELHSTHDRAVAQVKSVETARQLHPWLFEDSTTEGE